MKCLEVFYTTKSLFLTSRSADRHFDALSCLFDTLRECVSVYVCSGLRFSCSGPKKPSAPRPAGVLSPPVERRPSSHRLAERGSRARAHSQPSVARQRAGTALSVSSVIALFTSRRFGIMQGVSSRPTGGWGGMDAVISDSLPADGEFFNTTCSQSGATFEFSSLRELEMSGSILLRKIS